MSTKGDNTREKILNAGLSLWPDVTSTAVAEATGLTHAAILYHFPAGTLKIEIAKHAVRVGDSRVIVQLIAARHSVVKNMPVKDRIRHFNSI